MKLNFIGRDIVVFGRAAKKEKFISMQKAFVHLKEYLQSRDDDNEALFVSCRISTQEINCKWN